MVPVPSPTLPQTTGSTLTVLPSVSLDCYNAVLITDMSKAAKIAKSPDAFDEILLNAIDFAKRSVKELSHSPKYSMIHFAAAVELFLKARLLREHWSLVVTRPELACLPDFRSGKFHSVSMEEAIKRLRNVANEPVSDGAEKAFRAVADHRNRLIHFYHPGLGSSAKARERDLVVADQYKAWYFLYDLVTHSWAKYFRRHLARLAKLNEVMRGLEGFLKAKFESISPEIQEQTRQGANFEVCFYCRFPAAKVDAGGPVPPLFTGRCMVCGSYRASLHEQCPDCNEVIVIEDMAEGKCEKCDFEIDLDYLLEKYVPAYDPKDEEPDAGYCPECERVEAMTVVPYGDKYLCLSCLNQAGHVGQCGYCGESVADIEESYAFGCMFCDGAVGSDNS